VAPDAYSDAAADAVGPGATRIELLAMVEDTNDGTFLGPSTQPNGGPISIGVNPSLTIAAVAERCADKLVARGPSLGLPSPPADFRPGTPEQIVGPRVIP
jgi:hypothetical protein